MGFKLKDVAKVAVPVYGVGSMLWDSTKSKAPELPNIPDPTYYGEVPDFTPEELDYINRRRGVLDEYAKRLNAGPTAYDTTNDQIAAAEQKRYLDALGQTQGQLSVAQQQARQQEFERFKETAGKRGIRILGDDPSTATSNSTAGIQLLSEFNKRYDSLADQQRMADLNFGYNANTGRLGLIQQGQQNYYGNALNLEGAYGGIQDIYGGMRGAKYNRANANVDIENQFKLGQYERGSNQAILNANADNQTRANRLGLINSAIGAGSAIFGAMSTGGASAARGGGGMGFSGGGGGYAPYYSGNRTRLY